MDWFFKEVVELMNTAMAAGGVPVITELEHERADSLHYQSGQCLLLTWAWHSANMHVPIRSRYKPQSRTDHVSEYMYGAIYNTEKYYY